MYYTTGFCSGEIQELCALVAEIQSSIRSYSAVAAHLGGTFRATASA